VTLSPTGTQDFALVAPTDLPRTLSPIGSDRTAVETIEVHYTPRSNATHSGELDVTTNRGLVKVSLTGTATTPAAITANPAAIDIGDVTLGTSNFKTLTLVNGGGAALTVSSKWPASAGTDFYVTPLTIPPVAVGKYVEVQVGVTATKVGPYSSILELDTNDPQHPTVSIPVTANGVALAGAQVVKVDMSYDTGLDGTFGDDERNVQLILENPSGLVCNKATPAPMNWGTYGSPTWLAIAQNDDPARVVLAGATQDGTWRVQLNYAQDCKVLPTALVGAIVGLAGDALQAWLAGTVIVPGQDLGALIQKFCLSHTGTTADVKVYVNGVQVAERSASLGKTGDTPYVLDLVRTNGTFSVK
jgi:hypothetical protein